MAWTASGVQIIQIQDYEEKTNITQIKSCSIAENVYSVEKSACDMSMHQHSKAFLASEDIILLNLEHLTCQS